jgi:Protein of unknown function (DUF1559)
MPGPFDQESADYEDRPVPPPPDAPPPAAHRPRQSTLRVCLTAGLVFGVVGLCMGGMGLLGPVSRQAAMRKQSATALKQIGMAIHTYHKTYGEFPNNTYGPDGKPLLSWRVHILPYLEEDNLYKRFHLNEPWDGPNNSLLLSEMPVLYTGSMNWTMRSSGLTYYRGFSSPGAVFERRPGDVPSERIAIFGALIHPANRFDLSSIKDGPSNTIVVVEAWDPVEWTKPDDLDASPGKPFPKVGGFRWKNVFQAVMGDGSTRSFPLDTPEDKLRALVTHSGGEPVSPD